MIKIIRERDSGKTKELLTECAKHNGVYICKHPERVDDKCDAYGVPRVEARGYDYFKYFVRLDDGTCTTDARDVYIDELGCFVESFVPYLQGYTLTDD